MIKRPIITEKSMRLASLGFYTFEVDKLDTKNWIARVVKDRFGVDVVSVKTQIVKGKIKQQRKVRKSYQTPGYKKAVVEIKKGQKIALFEVTQKEKEPEVIRAEEEASVIKEKRGFLGPKIKVEKVSSRTMTQRKVIGGE